MVGLLTFGLAAMRFVLEGPTSLIGVVLLFGAVGMTSVPLVLRHTGSQTIAGALLPALGTLTLISFAALEGGLSAESLFWLPFIPFLFALFVGLRGMLVATAVLLLLVGGVAVADWSQLIPPPPITAAMATVLKWAAISGAVVFAGALARLYESNRRWAQAELEATRVRLEATIGALPDPILHLAPDGTITDAHLPEGMLFFLDEKREIVGTNIKDLLPGELGRWARGLLKEVLKEGATRREVFEHRTASHAYMFEIRFVAVASDECLAVMRDITESERFARLREDFVSVVSHELRTPLTSIKGSLGLLAGGVMGDLPEEAMGLVTLADRNAERLGALIEDILDIEKIEGGRVTFDLKVKPIEPLLRASVERCNEEATKAGIKLALVGSMPGAKILIDVGRFHQAFDHLISNAIKYSPQGSEVRLGAGVKGGQVWMEVSDVGPGIPPEFRGRIFERFSQAAPANTRDHGGAGLGLALCKAIIERHGGKIDFETSDRGTTFRVQLPKASSVLTPVPDPIKVTSLAL